MSQKSFADAYKEAGVDVTAGYKAVEAIKPLVESTYSKQVLGSIGNFGGLYKLDLKKTPNPVLVSGTDGVGTKLKLAFLLDKHDTVGIDCVAMCVNDIICSGALPLFFLDYIACGKNDPNQIECIVSGIVEGCKQADCALIGGETAEMPGFYQPGEYDIAGFSVGAVDESKLITGDKLESGDILIGLASSGIHSNGFSLVRKLFDVENTDLNKAREDLDGKSLGEILLEPTVIYVPAFKLLLKNNLEPVSLCHITGGGFYENVPRILNQNLSAIIDTESFPHPPIFKLIQREGNLSKKEMYNTFNMGIGMIFVIKPKEESEVLNLLNSNGFSAYKIGKIVKGNKEVVLL